MRWVYNDGGRRASGFKSKTGDCVVRAISIVTERPYADVYKEINCLGKKERITKRKKHKSNARTGVYKDTVKKYMQSIGWKWVPTMFIGQGCKVHLRNGELPMGRLLVNVSKHITAVIDGVIYDTYNPDRYGTRCVYGYWLKQ